MRRDFDRRRCFRRLDRFDPSDEPIALTGQRLEHPRFHGIVIECFADFFYRDVDGVFELDKLAVFPERFLNFIACDKHSGATDQQYQQARGLILQFDTGTVFEEFPGNAVQLKGFETYPRGL